MQKITATELARNLRAVLDRVRESGEQNAEQALADLYRTLPTSAAEGWLEDARRGSEALEDEPRDPWAF